MTEIDFLDSADANWWYDLPVYQRVSIKNLLDSGLSEEDAAAMWLSRTGPDNNFAFGAGSPGANFLSSVQTEFRKFLCGDSAYDDLRRDAKSAWNGTKLPVVAAIAAGIGATIGVAAAVIMPVVALLLSAAARIGLQAWCNMPAPPPLTAIPPTT